MSSPNPYPEKPASFFSGERYTRPEPLFASRYRIQKEAGRGGMGVVYEAYDCVLDERVAIKMPTIRTDDPKANELAESLRREVTLARRVTHPSVARVHDIGFSDHQMYVSMEYIEGQTLADKLKSEDVSIDDALFWSKQISCALKSAHEAGVLHLDLKPSNLLIRQGTSGRIVLVDFGIARVLGSQSVAVGTPEYMSPEALGDQPLTGAADVFSLGLVLFRMLTGELPFSGPDITARTFARVLYDAKTLPESYPKELRKLISQMLQRAPEARPDVGDVAIRLNQLSGALMKTKAPSPSPNIFEISTQDENAAESTVLLCLRSQISNPNCAERILTLCEQSHTTRPTIPLVTAMQAVAHTHRWVHLSHRTSSQALADAATSAISAATSHASHLPETHLADAIVASASGNLNYAFRAIERGLYCDPTNIPVHEFRTRLCVELGAFGPKCFDVLSSLFPDSCLLRILRAQQFAYGQDFKKAEAECESLIERNLFVFEAITLLGRMYIWRKDETSASALLNRFAEFPEETDFHATFRPLLEAITGQVRASEVMRNAMLALTASDAIWRRTHKIQCWVEWFSASKPDFAGELLTRLVHLPFHDLNWLLACPALDNLRQSNHYRIAQNILRSKTEDALRDVEV